MSISRRRLLQVGLVSGAAAIGGSYVWRAQAGNSGQLRFTNALQIPPLLQGTPQADGKKLFELVVRSAKTKFLNGTATPTIGVNGSFLGPTLKCRSGDQVTIKVSNKLAYDTTLHWHGLHVPAKADGGPHQIIRPGTSWSPSFEIKQKAALFWYHSHLMGRTGQQVNDGLAGLILIDNDESASLGMPSAYGVDDIPLVVQDRRFNRDGSFAYLTSMHDAMMGFQGDTILVNGTLAPYLTVRRQLTRLRLLNGSNSRIYNFAFEDGRSFTQIASDGSLLERPVRRKRLRLAPGERAEVLVEMRPNSSVFLMSYPDSVSGSGMMGRMMRGMVGNTETFRILELRAGKLEGSNTKLPGRLAAVPNWQESRADRTRHFRLDMPMMGGMMGMMRGRGMMGDRNGSGMMRGQMGINGKSMDIGRIDEKVPLGAVEIWAISNPSPLAHPFHIHDIQFRILDRNGRAPGLHEAGLKDTVLVDPGETVRVITEFSDFADPERPYMYHCHILEHEDAGMMGQFTVNA